MKTAVLISDFGANSPHIQLAKFKIESSGLYENVVALSDAMNPHQIIESGYFTRLYLHQFGSQTDFFLALDIPDRANFNRIVVSRIDSKKIISYNSGIQYVIADKEPMECIAAGAYTGDHRFVIQNGFLDAVSKPKTLDAHIHNLHFKQPIIESNLLIGHVMFIDHHGNAHTNIDKALFNDFIDSEYTIHLSRHEKSNKIYNHLGEVAPGKTICHWNEIDKMCISTHIGNAQKLVGLKIGRIVEIEKK